MQKEIGYGEMEDDRGMVSEVEGVQILGGRDIEFHEGSDFLCMVLVVLVVVTEVVCLGAHFTSVSEMVCLGVICIWLKVTYLSLVGILRWRWWKWKRRTFKWL